MSKQKGLIIGVILVAIILMAVGYASVTSSGLEITANAKASANTDNFKVYFTGANTVKSDETEGNIDVDVANGSVSATVDFNKGLGLDTMGESAYVILEIENGSEGIDAESVNVTTDGTSTDIFEFKTVMCNESGTEISDYEVPSGEKTYVKVTVSLKISPTDEASTTTTITLTASPKANV